MLLLTWWGALWPWPILACWSCQLWRERGNRWSVGSRRHILALLKRLHSGLRRRRRWSREVIVRRRLDVARRSRREVWREGRNRWWRCNWLRTGLRLRWLACYHGWLFREHIPQYSKEVEYGGLLFLIISMHAPNDKLFLARTHIPKCRPADQIWMVDLPLRIDVLARAHNHGLSRGHVDQRRLARVGMRHP